MPDHSDLGFQPVSTPHDDLGFTPSYQIGASESRIGHHLETHPAKIIPSMVDAIVSPIASIPAAAKEVYGYFTHPNDFMARKMDASQAASIPGAMSVNPPADAYTTALAAAGAAKGTPKPEVNIPRSMGETFGGEYTPPTAPAGGLPPSVLHKLGRYAASKLIPGGGIAYDLARNAASDLTAPKPPAPPPEALAVPAAPVDPILEHIARAKANVQTQAAPARAVPRPPEYYGVQSPTPPTPAPTLPPTLAEPAPTPPIAAAPAEVAAQPTIAPAAAEAPATVAKRITPGVKDANTLAAKFGDWGFSPSEAAGMNDAGWAKLAHDAGVKFPSAAVRDRAIRQLRSNLAGPEVPVTELIDKLKKSFSAKQ